MTYVDIVVYVEVQTITKLYGWELDKDLHPRFIKWYESLSGIKAINESNIKFDYVCQEW